MTDPKPLKPGEKPNPPIADENALPEQKMPGDKKPDHHAPRRDEKSIPVDDLNAENDK